MTNQIPQNSSFVKELQFVHVVTVAFLNEHRKLELSVFVYHNQEDAQKRFNRLMELHNRNPENSPLVTTETFLAGVYENFEQSLFSEGELGKVN